jgi:hypothetical protein
MLEGMRNPVIRLVDRFDRLNIQRWKDRNKPFITERQAEQVLGLYGIGLSELDIPFLMDGDGCAVETIRKFKNLTITYFQDDGLRMRISGECYTVPIEDYKLSGVSTDNNLIIPFSVVKRVIM